MGRGKNREERGGHNSLAAACMATEESWMPPPPEPEPLPAPAQGVVPGAGLAASACMMAAHASSSSSSLAQQDDMTTSNGKRKLPPFEASEAFTGARPGMCFKLGPLGVGYYLDTMGGATSLRGSDTIAKVRAQLSERFLQAKFREVELRVDEKEGAGLSLEHCEFGFLVEATNAIPAQDLVPGDVIVAAETRLLFGLSAPQMQASFMKRCVDGAELTVSTLEEMKHRKLRDPAVIDCWDPNYGRSYLFNKTTGKSGWTLDEVQTSAETAAMEVAAAAEKKPPIDLASFLTHGFAKPPPPKKAKKVKKVDEGAPAARDESDVAREERQRIANWNEGGRGGYTEQFLDKYKGCRAFVDKGTKHQDKRLAGTFGPGHGMDDYKKWTGSSNSFN